MRKNLVSNLLIMSALTLSWSGGINCTRDKKSSNLPVPLEIVAEPSNLPPGYFAFSQKDGSYIHSSQYVGKDLSFHKDDDGTPFFKYKGKDHEAKLISGEYSFTSDKGDTFFYAKNILSREWFLYKKDSTTSGFVSR